MKLHRCIVPAVLALVLMTAAGCRQTTVVSRQDQLAHLTTGTTVSSPADTVSSDTAATAPEETVSATQIETAPSQTIAVPSTQATSKPKETSPPATKTPSTSKHTETTATPTTLTPDTTVPSAPPETEPVIGPEDPYDISGHTIGSLEHQILAAINAERAAAGVAELALDNRLCAITSVRAYEISLSFDHTRPNGSNCFTVLDDYGYSRYSTAGENLLQCSGGYSAEDMVGLWMGSDGHRANILDPNFTAAGLAVYQHKNLIYIANLFIG